MTNTNESVSRIFRQYTDLEKKAAPEPEPEAEAKPEPKTTRKK